MKKCPFCAERIKKEAIKCKFCGEFIKNKKENKIIQNSDDLKLLSKHPYSQSLVFFTFLFIFTGGMYSFYWFYKRWKQINFETKNKYSFSVKLLALILFYPLSGLSFFHISMAQLKNKKGNSLGSFLKGLIFVVGCYFYYIFPIGFIINFTIILLTQEKLNNYWKEVPKNNWHEYKHTDSWRVVEFILLTIATLFYLLLIIEMWGII